MESKEPNSTLGAQGQLELATWNKVYWSISDQQMAGSSIDPCVQ